MKFRYVFLIAVVTFVAGLVLGAIMVGVPLSIKLMEARDELAVARGLGPDPFGDDEQVHILVAKQRISQWSTIRKPAEMFDVQLVRKGDLPPNAVVLVQPEMIDTLKGRRLRATVEPGHRLTEDDLLKKEVVGISGPLKEGKRAMTIPITADKAVNFFVVPGSKVDVIHTVDGKAKVVLENRLVLAIDLNTQVPEDKVGQPGATATLQLDNTEQVLKLAECREKGTLSLVMRAPDDKEEPAKPLPPPPPPFEDEK
jgi:Flp pilus assembly protein CpaB